MEDWALLSILPISIIDDFRRSHNVGGFELFCMLKLCLAPFRKLRLRLLWHI